MAPNDSCCNSSQTVAVPGPQGPQGAAAPIILTTASFVIPASGSSAVVTVTSTAYFQQHQNILIGNSGGGIGNFQVDSIISPTQFFGLNLGFRHDFPPGSTIPSGSVVTSGPGYFDFLNLTGTVALTDSTGGAISTTLAATCGIRTLAFYVTLANISASGLLGAFTPGYAFKILKVDFAVEKAVTTAAKLATLTPNISGVAVTGGVLSLTSANCTPASAVVAGSTVTAANTGTAIQTFSIVASAVTTFVEGSGWILVRIQNLDDINALASIASLVNTLLASVKPQ